MSVTVGTSNSVDTCFKISKALSSPIPVKLSIRLLLAFLKLPLNTNGIFYLTGMLRIRSAISIAIFSPSIAHGPAKRKKLLDAECFIFGIVCKFICSFYKGTKIHNLEALFQV